jgi:hypothetical protein
MAAELAGWVAGGRSQVLEAKAKKFILPSFPRSNLLLRLVTYKIQLHKLQANELQTYKKNSSPPLSENTSLK